MDIQGQPGYIAGFSDVRAIRDLGGRQTADGRTVRRGLLYRGAALADLTPNERRLASGLGLSSVLDLRAEGERELSGTWVPDGATYHHVSGMYDRTGTEVDFSPKGIARMQTAIASDPDHFMEGLYASMAHDNPALHRLVEIVRADALPLYFHCTAGKDRTGVAAATIYILLGVDDATIMEEYLLTNGYRASIINMAPEDIPDDVEDDLRERWAKLNGVDASLLQAFLDAVDRGHETRDAWLLDEFGLDETELEALRSRLLTNARP